MTTNKGPEAENHSLPSVWFPFYGGLGDILLRIYQTRFWYFLENTDCRAGVAVASVNPFATELFRWHVNRSKLVIFDLANAVEHFSGRGFSGTDLHEAVAKFAGLEWPFDWKEYKSSPPPGWRPTFFAPDYLDDSDHLVFHPFAGLKSRSLSADRLEEIVRCLGELPCTVYIPSRDFIRLEGGRTAHQAETLPEMSIPDNIVSLKNLSVPATLNLIRNARGFVGTHSSLILAAAHENIPSLSLYPNFLADDFGRATGYASYMKMDHMSALPFGSVSGPNLNRWLSSTFDRGSFADSRADRFRVDRLARAVFEFNGKLNVDWHSPPDFATPEDREKRRQREICSESDLPTGRYKIWRLNFRGLSDFGDPELAALGEAGKGLATITNLNLAGTSITPDGFRFLDWLGDSLLYIDLGEQDRKTNRSKLAKILPRARPV